MISRRLCHRTQTSILTFLGSTPSGTSQFSWGTAANEHRLNHDFIDALAEGIQASLTDGCKAIVLHNQGKFWSNGMDLKWIDANLSEGDALQKKAEGVMAELLTCPVPTVASIAGHCAAAGSMMALACDYRVMASNEKSLFFIPAVELGLVYSPGMIALMSAKLSPDACRDLVLMGCRYTAAQLETDLKAGFQAYQQRSPGSPIAKHWPDLAVGLSSGSSAPADSSSTNIKFDPSSATDYVLAASMELLEKKILIRKRTSPTALQEAKRDLYANAFKLLRETDSPSWKSMGWTGRPTKGVDKASKL